MNNTATFRVGDEIELTHPIGVLKTSEYGLIVEVDELDPNHPVRAIFPRLIEAAPKPFGPWIPKDVDLSNMHEGDAIPLGYGEFIVNGNLYDRALADD